MKKKLLPLILVFFMVFNLFSFTASTVKANSAFGNVVLILDDPDNSQQIDPWRINLYYKKYFSAENYYYKRIFDANINVENVEGGKRITISNLNWNNYDELYISFVTNKYLFKKVIRKNEIDQELHIAPEGNYAMPKFNIEFAQDDLNIEAVNFSSIDENGKVLYLGYGYSSNIKVPEGIYNIEIIGRDSQYGYFLEKDNVEIKFDPVDECSDINFSLDDYKLIKFNINNILNKNMKLSSVAILSRNFHVTPHFMAEKSKIYDEIYINKYIQDDLSVIYNTEDSYTIFYRKSNVSFENSESYNLGTQFRTLINLTKEFYTQNDYLTEKEIRVVDEYDNKVTFRKNQQDILGKLELISSDGSKIEINDVKLGYPSIPLKQFNGTYLIRFSVNDAEINVIPDEKNITIINNNQSVEPFNLRVTTDKTLIKVGEEVEVTITAKNGENPLVNEYVRLEGAGINLSGYTNSEGKFTARFNPQWSDNIRIAVRNKWFMNKLVAIYNDQSVIEARLKGINGNYVDNVYLNSRSNYSLTGFPGEDGVVRIITRPGEHKLALSADGYYLTKDLNVTETGKIYSVEFDAAEAKEVMLNFNYMSQPAQGFTINVSTPDFRWGSYIGSTDQTGQKKLFVSPGNYDITMEGWRDTTRIILSSNINIDNDSNTLSFNWDDTNTGKLVLNTNGSEFRITQLMLNGKVYFIDNRREIILSQGDYKLGDLELRTSTGTRYWFRAVPGSNIISILPGETTTFNFDLNEKSVAMELDRDRLMPGQWLFGKIQLLTNSNYFVDWIGNSIEENQAQLILEKSNGERIDLGKYDFRGFKIQIPKNIEPGIYKLIAKVNFGSLYGEKELIKEINIQNNQVENNITVTSDKTIIKVGEETEVTITVKNGAVPIANEYIRLEGAGVNADGYTDGEGKWKIKINPRYPDEFRIKISDKEFDDELFALDKYTGILELRVKNDESNIIKDYSVSIMGNDWRSDDYCSDYVLRKIAWIDTKSVVVMTKDGYYMKKDINLNVGQINYLEFNLNETQEVLLNFKYNNQAISNGNVIIKTLNDSWGNYVGQTDINGNKKIYLTPGIFRFQIIKLENKKLILQTGEINIDQNNKVFSFNWDTANTGTLKVISDMDEYANNQYILKTENDVYEFNSSEELIINTGDLKIKDARIHNFNTNEAYYFISNEGENIISIKPNETTTYELKLKENARECRLNKDIYNTGETLEGEVYLITNGNYRLISIDGKYEDNFVDVYLEKPNGERIYYGNMFFRHISINIPNNFEAGKYRLIVKTHFGNLYGEKELVKEFNVENLNDLKVESDKTIIKVGEETEVTITVKNGAVPIANEYIRLEGAGVSVSGYTNNEGKFVARIRPQWGEKIRIIIRNRWFFNQLLTKHDDEAVLEVALKDREGNYVNDIYLSLFNEYHGSGEAGDGNIVRSVLWPGQYKAILSSRKGYYLVKNIELNPGEYKRVEFDANEGVEVTLKANYMNQAFANAEVKIKTNDKYNNWGDHLGWTDANGESKFIITPGTYDVIFERWDGERVKLTNAVTVDGNTNLLTFNWDETNTGKINAESDIYGSGYNIETINLNDTEYYFFDNNSWITNSGNYNITRIIVRNNSLNEWYIYEPIGTKQFTLNPGETNNINIELKEKSCELKLDKETVNAGEAIIGSVDIITNGNYLLNYVNSNGNEYYLVDVSLQKPNGEIIDYGKRYFKGIYVWIPPYFESGTYKLIVKGYFGNLYGEKQFVKEINVEGGINTVPGIPYNVVPVVDDNKVVITWDHEFGAEGYRIYRSESVDGEYVLIGEIADDPSCEPAFIDENVEPGKTYYYRITSINRFGEGDPCEPVSITIPTQQNNKIKYGDVNNDGVVNSMDYSLIKRFILNKVTFTQEQIKAADVDGDGSVTSLDYSLVKRYILGKIAKFPVE